MIEAAKTYASTGEIWAIVVVAVSCLAFWLSMVAWADKNPRWGNRRMSQMSGPVLGGMHVGSGGRSVAPNRDAPSVFTSIDDVPYDQRDYEPEHDDAAQWRLVPAGPGQSWIPVQRGDTARGDAAREMPAQRSGEGDRAERSATAPADRDDDQA